MSVYEPLRFAAMVLVAVAAAVVCAVLFAAALMAAPVVWAVRRVW